MTGPEEFLTTVAEHRSDAFVSQCNEFHLGRPLDDVLRIPDGYRLDLSLTPRPEGSRARYRDRWASHRFEPVGRLFLVRNTERVHVRSEPGRGSSVVCHFRPQDVRGWLDGDLDWTDRHLETCLDIGSARLKQLMSRIGTELRGPGFAHDVLVDSLTLQLAIELRRHFSSSEATPSRRSGGLAPWRLRRINERLEELDEPPTLAELAELCGISVRQLTRGFRASKGRSIAEHVAETRMARARRLIADGTPIKSIARTLGFRSVSSFTHAFRCSNGIPPSRYREGVSRSG